MSLDFDKVLQEIKFSAADEISGYQADEIEQIERLYDIKVSGDFQKFLSVMGRCSGGVIGDRDIILYRQVLRLRSHLLLQVEFIEELHRLGLYEIIRMKPFVIAIESETIYYFLLTYAEDNEKLYLFDENTDEVRKADFTFSEYIQYQSSEIVRGANSDAICKSDLLLI